ncbi:MAG TPA: adenosylcobinamide amidohydrolase, partial [Bryobacteraceae bacterium]|nr:adenosylcobinamide amidohydrolase [Bryobacteraceae bacterium]
SCEATAHRERHEFIRAYGQEAYHNAVCEEMGLPPDEVALLGTAANMNYAAIVTREDQALIVTAVVTAGVQGNATCAGDPAHWREAEQGWQKVDGTINTMLFINRPLREAAMAQAVVTMTEGKSAALQRLGVASLYSSNLATGTGTDQYAIAAPVEGAPRLTSASPHVKLGELIGGAVRDATLEALRWQNGLEPSYTRSIFTALGRYGLLEEKFFNQIAPLLNEADLELLRRNSKSVFYEPHVSAAAYAFAAVLDRVRSGTLPEGAAQEALRHQAACMAASLSAKTHLWDSFRTRIGGSDPVQLVLQAIALGWTAKWRS